MEPAPLVGIQVSKATSRRATLHTGQAALARDEAEEERLKREVPQAPEGADKQQLSADGAMVHLVGGEWVEVKTLIMGEVTCNKRGEICTQELSTFSRLADAERFTQASLVETHRRGLERATAVCAVQDGAEWLQGFVDYHRADAVRILDFAHAAEYINQIGQAVQAAGGRLPRGLRECGTDSNTRDPSACSSTWPGWPRAIPVPLSRRNWRICRNARRTCTTRPIRPQAGPLARAVWKVPIRWSWKHA